MPVNLSKGSKVSLAKVAAEAGVAGLSKIVVGLGWDTNRYDGGSDFDLDASAFLTGANGKVRGDEDFIFYNRTSDKGHFGEVGYNGDIRWIPDLENSSVIHTGDNRTGDGEGDDEQIKVDLTKVPADVEKISFIVTIDQAYVRSQNFGMVENSYIRVVDEASGTELIRYDLGEDYSIETAVVVGELYRNNGEWKFNAVGSGFQGGLAALCKNYGIDAE
jgi:tellurium resistance protein TerD